MIIVETHSEVSPCVNPFIHTLTEIRSQHVPDMALSVDHLVADIRKLSMEREYANLATQLDKYSDQLAQTDCSVLDTMIECLDIKVHSLGIMALL